MSYRVVLKDERPTSNIERPTSNEKTNREAGRLGSQDARRQRAEDSKRGYEQRGEFGFRKGQIQMTSDEWQVTNKRFHTEMRKNA